MSELIGRFALMKEFDGDGRDVTVKSLNRLYVGDGDPKVEKEIKIPDGRTMPGVNHKGYTYRLKFYDHAHEKERMLNIMYDDFFEAMKRDKARAGLRGILRRSNENDTWLWTFNETITSNPTPESDNLI